MSDVVVVAHQETQEVIEFYRRKLKNPWWLIEENSKFRRRWEVVTALALVFTAVVTPYEVALFEVTLWDKLFIANRIIDVIFLSDMVFSFLTSYRDENLNEIKVWSKISCNYLRGWFLLDLMSILPYDLIGGGKLRMLRVIRIFRLLKLLRVLKMNTLFQQYQSHISLSSYTLSILKGLFYLITFGHWLSCVWIMTADMQKSNQPTWLDLLGSNFYGLPDPQGDFPDIGAWRDELSTFQIYSGACYWATVSVTSVGYGDITPQNASEMLLATLYLIAGSFFWAWFIGTMSTIVSTCDPHAIEHQQTLDELNRFMSDKNFPSDVRRRLRTFISQANSLSKNSKYQLLIDKFSPVLKAEMQDRNCAWINDLGMFGGEQLSLEFVNGFCRLMHGSVYEARETVPWKDNLFCVGRGIASHNGRVKMTGSFWGEDFILTCHDLKYKVDGNAMTFVEILVLEREEFFDLLKDFPRETALVRRAVVRIAMIRGLFAAARSKAERRKKNQQGGKPYFSSLVKGMLGMSVLGDDASSYSSSEQMEGIERYSTLPPVYIKNGSPEAARNAKDAIYAQVILSALHHDKSLKFAESAGNYIDVEKLCYGEDGVHFFGRVVRCSNVPTRCLPGVVLIHTAVGPHDIFLDWKARALAVEGYVVLIADMFGDECGRGWNPIWSAAARKPLTDDRRITHRRASAAIKALISLPSVDSSRIAALGYSFGGSAVLDLARTASNDTTGLRAVVSFHGILDGGRRPIMLPFVFTERTTSPRVLICHGDADPFTSAEALIACQNSLKEVGIRWEMITFGGVKHGFTNPAQVVDDNKRFEYDDIAADRAWTTALLMLRKELGTSSTEEGDTSSFVLGERSLVCASPAI